MCNPALVWIPNRTYDSCTHEADEFYPLETGGVLMGYWFGPDTTVVTATIGAGPKARRERYRFEADQNCQAPTIWKSCTSPKPRLASTKNA